EFIVSLDANFQQQHHSYSSEDSLSESNYPSTFLKPSQITKKVILWKKTETQGRDIKACSLFTLSMIGPCLTTFFSLRMLVSLALKEG
ncbi:hypothetical protein CROQUDRAFT_49701, partial [Cronartium quercuum f. sp. fusiforme G11]